MDCSFTQLAYKETGYFTPIIIDYLDNAPALRPFYTHLPNIEGLNSAINERRQFKTDRHSLVSHLQEQYKDLAVSGKLAENINLLKNENTFTITTAHQPALFTGTLYFIYKIFHAIRLAE